MARPILESLGVVLACVGRALPGMLLLASLAALVAARW